MQVWRIDVANGELSLEPVQISWNRLGGRGWFARILLDEKPRVIGD